MSAFCLPEVCFEIMKIPVQIFDLSPEELLFPHVQLFFFFLKITGHQSHLITRYGLSILHLHIIVVLTMAIFIIITTLLVIYLMMTPFSGNVEPLLLDCSSTEWLTRLSLDVISQLLPRKAL